MCESLRSDILDPLVSEVLHSSITKASRFDMSLIQNMWVSKCPKCNQSFTGEMRMGLEEAWWSQVCDVEEKHPEILSKAHACLINCGNPELTEMCATVSMILT